MRPVTSPSNSWSHSETWVDDLQTNSHTASIAAGKTAPLHAAEHDAADGAALALLDAIQHDADGLA